MVIADIFKLLFKFILWNIKHHNFVHLVTHLDRTSILQNSEVFLGAVTGPSHSA